MPATVPLFSVFAFLGFLSSVIPLAWQFEAWNTATVWYIFWVAVSCFSQYFNAIVWNGNTENPAPAWCEISIRIAMAASVGLPAASLCINRRLYSILRMPLGTAASSGLNRRAIIVDSLACGLFPSLYIVLQLITQRHRFSIFEDVGCVADHFDSLPTYFITFAAPLLLSFTAIVYAVISFIHVANSSHTLTEMLAAHQKTITPGRFLRLHTLSLITSLFLTIPLALLTIAANSTFAFLSSAVSLAAHDGVFDFEKFSFVPRIPRTMWAFSTSTHASVELARWTAPVCGLLILVFLGIAEEAREQYVRAFKAVSNAFWNALARIGFKKSSARMPTRHQRFRPRRLISDPIRPVSGTGSLADVDTPHVQIISAPLSLIGPSFSSATTAEDPFSSSSSAHPTSSASSASDTASQQRSFVQVRPDPNEPGTYILPPNKGWYHFSNPGQECPEGGEIANAVEDWGMEMKELEKVQREVRMKKKAKGRFA
ncbi:pheromone receptor [Favolaschia claudopus]|uniref:Pheromone receptor n=1 Tax=Favolaschia claudopus TaxID=2862362 RepID=A0AAW0D3E9_9AGAR